MLNISYYGISLSTNQLKGNRFLNCFLSGLSETISYIIAYFIVENYGRRNTYIVSTLLAAVLIGVTPYLGFSEYTQTYFQSKVNNKAIIKSYLKNLFRTTIE